MEPTSNSSEFSIGLGHKFFNAFAKAGGTPTDANAIAEDPDFIRSLLEAHRRGTSVTVAPPTFPTCRTIKLGTHKTVAKLIQAIEKGDAKIGDWARDIAKKVTLASQPIELELVVVSGAELGCEEVTSRQYIYDKALSLGLSLCPAEVGLQLRRQYKNQPIGEWLLVAMEPIADSGGSLDVFSVERDDGDRWLRTHCGLPGSLWSPGGRWVFSRSKQ